MLQDPAIKQMAEQIAGDPSFQGLTQQLQESMAGMMGGGGFPGMPGMPGANNAAPAGPAGGMPAGGLPAGGLAEGGMPGGLPDPANFDPTRYMQAMSGMFQNPQFMQMAEKLGQAIIQVMPPP